MKPALANGEVRNMWPEASSDDPKHPDANILYILHSSSKRLKEEKYLTFGEQILHEMEPTGRGETAILLLANIARIHGCGIGQ